ncbi:Cof-type HAD-IIB family hydrolase [Streptococcus tangpeifui]|uniref:Cof-type HAD-IIB family hydrolase n=1 Tax=Streptococcus tangpeifui TaxID=2709400 RepID=UPI0013EB7B16|nr:MULTISPECIES: Cof-type HAD-IIB family hydrolase [unclassified Streptococcus]
MSKIKIVATDLDGTLLNNQLLLSDRNCIALHQLKKKGIHVVLCSGRPFNGVKHLLTKIGLDGADYTISYNGSLIQTADGREVLHYAKLSPYDFQKLNELFTKFGLGLHAMTMDRMYSYNQEVHPLTIRESYLGKLPLTVLRTNIIVQKPIIKLMAVGDGQRIDQAMAQLPKEFADRFSFNKSEDFYLEIMQKGDNKAKALQILMERLGLSPEQLMAFGNNQNDLEMIRLAEVGVAVENAVPELKKVSNFLTESNDHDGVALFLERYDI